MAVVNNIKEIREQRGIHQNDLAKATGYCTKTIGRIELSLIHISEPTRPY